MNLLSRLKRRHRRNHLLKIRRQYMIRLWKEWAAGLRSDMEKAKQDPGYRRERADNYRYKGNSFQQNFSFVSPRFKLGFSLQGNSDTITLEFDHAIISKLFNDEVKVRNTGALIQYVERNVVRVLESGESHVEEIIKEVGLAIEEFIKIHSA